MNKLALKGLKVGFKLITIQISVVCIAAFIGLVFKNVESMQSILVGGFSVILPNSLFAILLFSTAGASQLNITMRRFFRGAALKLVLSSILFALAMKSGFLIPFLFIGFVVAILAHVFTPVSIT